MPAPAPEHDEFPALRRWIRCFREKGMAADVPFLIVAKVDPSVGQDIRRKHSDGHEDNDTFVRHVEETEGGAQ